MWRWSVFVISAFFCFVVSERAFAATTVPIATTITTSTVWRLDESPYLVQGVGQLSVTSELVIEPGVVVKFNSGSIRVRPGGRLLARGTEAQPIIFTSYHDDAGGDTDSSAILPQAGDWYGLKFEGDTSELAHVAVRYAGENFFRGFTLLGAVEINSGSSIVIEDSEITDNYINGVYIDNGAQTSLSRLVIERNREYGISSRLSSTTTSFVTESIVRDNTRGPLRIVPGNTLRLSSMGFGGSGPQLVSFATGVNEITSHAVWPQLLGLTYAATIGQISVVSGASLTIEPGVIVKFDAESGIYARGDLYVQGTMDLPVILTSHRDTSVGAMVYADPSVLPASGDWGGVHLDRTVSSTLSYVTIRYGGVFPGLYDTGARFNWRSSVILTSAAASIDHVTIDTSRTAGMTVRGTSTLSMNHTVFTNTPAGIDSYHTLPYTIRNNSFVSTTSYAIRNNTGILIDAERNWWGDDSGPAPAGRGGSLVTGSGTPVTSTILYDPWIGLRDPVILIPGILGSELWRGDELLWPNILRMVSDRGDEFMDPLMMNVDGFPLESSVVVGDIIRSVDVLISEKNVFNLLIQEFIEQGYVENVNLFVFPYDWRLDINTNSDRLNTFIQENLASVRKVDIVAHSMGGLVTKQYLLDHSNSSTVDTLIFIGTPHLGAPGSAKTLLFGDSLGVERFFTFLNPLEIKKIGRNMSSIYQLLPSREYVSRSGGYLYDYIDPGDPLTYDQGHDFLRNHDANSALLSRADAFHTSALDNFVFPSDMNVFNISGCKESTIGSMVRRYHDPYRTGNFSQPEAYEYYLGYVPGDETVPLVSSDALSLPLGQRFYVTPTSHSTMPSQQDIRELVVDLVRYPHTRPTLPTTIAQSSRLCRLRGRQISTHSPVNIHVYDSLGNHVGPNPDGSLDMNIPGVSYDIVDHNTFVFLPDDSSTEYRVELAATATGTFNMRVIDIADDEPRQTVYYNAVPIITASRANVQLDVSSSTSQSVVTLALDYAGSSDYVSVAPASILDATSSQDFVVPVTAAALYVGGTDVAVVESTSSSIRVELLASDDSSGVLRTEYSLDGGVSWALYTQPFIVDSEGMTVLYRSIDRAGNMEGTGTAVVPIDRTPPQAVIGFDILLRDFVFAEQDTSSGTVRVDYSQISASTNTVAMIDVAENSTEIAYTTASTTNGRGYFTRALRLESVRHGFEPWQLLEKNQLLAQWQESTTGTLRWAQVTLQVKNGLYIIAKYDVGLDETIWWQKNVDNVLEEIGRFVGNRLFNVQINNLDFILN